MYHYVLVVAFIIIFSILSTIVWYMLEKGGKSQNILKVNFFFSSTFLFVLTFVKIILGNIKENIFESFWNAQLHTYVHYGIPLFIMALIIPLAMKLIWKEKAEKIIEMADSLLFFEILIAFIVGININNMIYVFVYVFAAICGVLCTLVKVKKGTSGGVQEKKDITLAAYMWGLWVTLVLIANPNELFLANFNEFPIGYWNFLTVMLCGGVIIWGVGVCGSFYFLSARLYSVMMLFLFSYSVMGYVQSMILNGKLAAMDGEMQNWSVTKMLVNALIWLLCVVIICFCFKKKENTQKIYKVIAIYIMTVQVISMLFLIVSTDMSMQKASEALTTDNALEVSKGENVIVFVLDRFDGETMDEILESDKEFLEPMKDFTYYENATCQFARTSMAIPYLLTGTEYEPGMVEDEYLTYAYQKSRVVQEVVENGYRVGLYTDISLIDDKIKEYLSNYSNNIERKCNVIGTISIMAKCSKYKMMPFLIKNKYFYYTHDIMENMVSSEGIWNVDNDIPFYEMLKQRGLEVSELEEKGAFLFYHLYGAHPPFRMTEDLRLVDEWESNLISQAKGSLKILYYYIEQLKRLGKYEESTIIVIADHGIQVDFKESGNPIPLVLVKEAMVSQKQLKISKAPVSQKEFIPTILQAMKIESGMYGRTYEQVPENEKNKRIHADIWGNNINIYEIDGNVKDLGNWKQVTE